MPTSGKHSLHYAARRNELRRIEDCLEKGCDVNEQDKKGRSSLFIACERGHFEAAKALLEAGANVNLRTPEGISPLDAALKTNAKSQPELMSELIWSKADLECPGMCAPRGRGVISYHLFQNRSDVDHTTLTGLVYNTTVENWYKSTI